MPIEFQKAQFLQSYGLAAQLPKSCCREIVFCGRSNVGKSTLINRLCNRKSLARVSSTPGKTATVNFYSAGESAYLVDLPGYGYAKRSKAEVERWSKLLDRYFRQSRDIALVLLLLDVRHEPSADDTVMLDYLRETGTPFACVLTKCDKLGATRLKERIEALTQQLEEYGAKAVWPFSAMKADLAQTLRDNLSAAAGL